MTTSAPTAVRTRGPRRRAPRQFGQRAAFLGPALGLLALLVVVPLIYTITLAVQDMPASLRGGTFVGLDNFAALAEDGRFWAATARTFIYSISAVVIETVLGVLVALALHQEFRSRAMLRSLVLLPMIATPVAIAMVWRLMFQPQLGVLNTILEAVGLSPLDWVADPALALPSLILVDIWEWTPLITLITLAGLAGLPSEPLEAAMVDGTNAWQRFWYVTLPMLRPVIGVAVLLRFIEAMRTFDPIFVITGGGPREATETLNLYVYQLAFQYLRPSYAAAAVIVFVIFMVLCSLAVVRLSKGEKR
ncbi:MAG TPA: sugar ABC transporter permease [Protaetiibacter sp.]|nr:sugar ABC transporter permease [Protaetiibacter sp.]